jgi:hypothetical protein
LKANHKLKENYRRRQHKRMIRLKNRGNLIEETRETEATIIRATGEKHGSGSNEARTANSTFEGVATVNTLAIGCVMLADRGELLRT